MTTEQLQALAEKCRREDIEADGPMRLVSRPTGHARRAELPAHTRLALSVIERAVRDIQGCDASLQRSAATFLNGSEEFFFWTHVLEQDSHWLLRALRARLREDSPRAFGRLSQRLGHYDVTALIGEGGWASATVKTRRNNHGR